jgi:hypothetical protein
MHHIDTQLIPHTRPVCNNYFHRPRFPRSAGLGLHPAVRPRPALWSGLGRSMASPGILDFYPVLSWGFIPAEAAPSLHWNDSRLAGPDYWLCWESRVAPAPWLATLGCLGLGPPLLREPAQLGEAGGTGQ